MIFFDHLLTSSDLYLPAPFSAPEKGQDKFRSTFQQLVKKILFFFSPILFISPVFLSAISLLLKFAGNTNPYI